MLHRVLNFYSICAIVIAGHTVPTALAAEPVLNQAQYLELKQIAIDLLTRFPPENFVVIGLGQSPSPVIAFLQGLSPRYAINLPLSGFTARVHGNRDPSIPDFVRLYDPLSATDEGRLFQHFDRFLPSSQELGEKSVVVIDYSETGKQILAVKSYLSKYYRNNEAVTAAPIVSQESQLDVSESARSSGESLSPYVLRGDSSLIEMFESAGFDQYSEFGQFYLNPSSPEQPHESPLRVSRDAYRQLRSRIQDFINADEGLKPVLLKLRVRCLAEGISRILE